MRGEGMYQRVNDYLGNCLRRFDKRCGAVGSWSQWASIRCCRRQQKLHRASYLAGLLLVTLAVQPILAQEQSSGRSKSITNIATMPRTQQQTPALPAKRPITISEAVSIFLQQNL